ncbi:MAG: hypothetical protein RLZZ602_1324 [Pseudomonadota bacterium]
MFSLDFWTVEQSGQPRRWFGTAQEAREYANEQFDHEVEGIPFIAKHSYSDVAAICWALNEGERKS